MCAAGCPSHWDVCASRVVDPTCPEKLEAATAWLVAGTGPAPPKSLTAGGEAGHDLRARGPALALSCGEW